MKTTTLALFLVLLGFNSYSAHAGDVCAETLSAHINEIDNSEDYFKTLASHSDQITPYEIVQMQKTMTARYKSLKNFLNVYNDEKLNCTPKVLATAVEIYDYSKVGKSIFANTVLRRVFMGFYKYPLYELMDYIDNYKKFTSNEMIEQTNAEIDASHIELPAGVVFHPSDKDYDPNLYALSDLAIKGTTNVVVGVAKLWGFISDHVNWRQGRIRDNQEAIKVIREKLKPLDMVFEKREFKLSNYTIPGHFGHVGIWLGTKEELVTMGIWDKEYFAPFRPFVEAGKNIVEIRKEGLGFQSIDTFINLDEIAVARIKNIAEDRADSVYEGLSEQIGKRYDFKFDIRTADKITCAELIAFSYGDIKWPQTKTLFQVSLRPDDLAVLTLDKSSPAEFVLYFKGIKAKDGGGFESKDFQQWSKLFKVKEHLSPEEVKLAQEKKEKQDREREERNEFQKMYGGA
ncbi:MAG: hypothetical protein H7177_17330 [Rhizobacter sp.]|nr:hypothetical protein [Bacteriovorax sp.]